MRLALAQINSVVGELDGNAAKIAARLDEARDAGADLVLFPQLAGSSSASPFPVGEDREGEEMLRVGARDNSCFVALCNAVGGQDELIFDGNSVVIDDEGELVARAPGFEEALLVVDVDPVAAV